MLNDGEAHFLRALAFARKDNLDKAVADYREAIRLEPKTVEGYKHWGPAKDRDLRSKTLDRLEEALAARKDDARACYIKGIALQREEKLDEAITQYDQAVQLYPRYPEVHYNRGLAYRKKGDMERAVTDYSHAIDLDPRLAAAYANRGYVYYKLGDYPSRPGRFRQGAGNRSAKHRRPEEPGNHPQATE